MSIKKNTKKTKSKKLFIFNKYVIAFLFIYFLLGVGGSYAYYAYRVEDTNIIVGNVVAIDTDLEVELVSGTTNKMVPLSNDALSNAINGVGSTNGACIDSVGNLSCQVYRITLINKGSRLQHITGTVELYAKSGTNNVYTNLKWRELTNATTVKDSAVVNGMEKTTLVSDLTMESKTEKTWYIAVWISETNGDQLNTDKGDFGGTVTFEAGVGSNDNTTSTPNVITETILAPNAESDENIDFSQTSEESDTNGVYYVADTIDAPNPIYYYRGNVNNNMIFAETCWKIVRTTETGGLKLLYNGTPAADGSCNNSGGNSQISTKAFNTNDNSPAYVGYMYGTVYSYSTKSMNSVTATYGNDITYSNGTYTLKDTISGSSWSSIYSGGLNNYHYTCFSTGTTCTSVNYIYSTSRTQAVYITLTGGKKVENALSDMLDNNYTSSTIKGDQNTEGTLDYWYYNNIQEAGYSSYIEDTVWCNDRSISQLNGWNPDGGNTLTNLFFSAYDRIRNLYTPSLECSRDVDKFTKETSNGNGALDYPVGLLTADEIMLAGGKMGGYTGNSTYYLNSGSTYWVGSPCEFGGDYGYTAGGCVVRSGILNGSYMSASNGVRPSISLAPGFNLTGDGDGSVSDPYVVE